MHLVYSSTKWKHFDVFPLIPSPLDMVIRYSKKDCLLLSAPSPFSVRVLSSLALLESDDRCRLEAP